MKTQVLAWYLNVANAFPSIFIIKIDSRFTIKLIVESEILVIGNKIPTEHWCFYGFNRMNISRI